MNKKSLSLVLIALLALASSLAAAPASLRMLTQNKYVPGLPVLVRVEGYAPDGSRDKETWDIDATLSADGGVTLSTNIITLRNGMGSILVTFSGGGNFNLTATVGGVSVTRPLQTLGGTVVTKVGGTLSGGSGTWSGFINVTSDVIVTNYTLTIQSNTVVVINGISSGTTGASIIVNSGGSIQSLGTELHPVTITCSNVNFANRWGQIRHNNSQPSLYRHTFIHRAGRSPGEGHTGQAAAIRTSGSTLTFESTTISDLCETSSASPNFGTPAKVMFALSSVLSFNDCLFQRARTGPEIDGTALLYTNSYVLETRGPDDSDGLYVHAQQGGQTVKIVDSVFGMGDDDGVDTLGPVMTIENCIFREWNSLIEDAKGISVFDGVTDVRHCLFTDCTVGIAAKTTSSVRVNINNSTFMGNLTNVLAAYKANAPGPLVELRITNSIMWGGNPVHSDFDSGVNNSTNFIIRYCDIGEPWVGTGNINSDPLFVNAAAKNFRVQIASPAINAGNPASPFDVDGTIADLGYFPFLTSTNPLIAFGSDWRYLDNGSNQGTNWSARLFDDTPWASGPAQLGYSFPTPEGDEVTTVSYGPDPNNKYITTYFRRAFTILNPSEFTNLEAHLLVDDGAVVWLNGQEAYRVNLPAGAGAVTNQTLALLAFENTLVTNSISPSLLVAGTNVIAVEVHQQALTSSDLSFDFELRGQRQAIGNQPPNVSITSPANGSGFITPANVAITVSASDSDGTVTNTVLYQNGSLLTQSNTSGFTFNWNVSAISNYTLVAVATDNAGASSTSAPVAFSVSAVSSAVTNILIGYSNIWKYLDNGTDQGTAWQANGFNDSTWASGQGQLGYGDGDEFTVVSYGPDPNNKYVTTYFRRAFSVTNAAAYTNMTYRLIRDDGAVVYLNGVEVFRALMPAGPVLFNTLASGNAAEPVDVDTVTVAGNPGLVEGTNVLAVEIHQVTLNSSDISFDLRLTGIRSGETNARPIISLTNPTDGTFFGTPASLAIGAAAFDPDGTVTNVAFYSNGVKLGDDTSNPFSFNYNPAAGTYALVAVATDNVGQSTTSSVVNITVSTNIAPPVVFSKTPAPGNVTVLTNINVIFSKIVAGVNASDLLINGLPASGVSGSGSNYNFSFPEPSFGVVAITWATGHGITDTFIPSHAFATNSAGANWQYQYLDAVPPTLAAIVPQPGATVAALNSVSVTFSEPVTGVNASDLLINTMAATNVTGSGAGPYVFGFPQPPQGVVSVDWAGAHGIQDSSANPFAAVPWSYTLDSNSTTVVLSEIMFHPSSENSLEEYIELYNKGGTPVNLNGWKITSGVTFTFSNVSLAGGGYLVVAASRTAFTNKYPTVTNVVGDWVGTLNNNGERIKIEDAAGNTVNSVRYAEDGDWGVRQRGPLDLNHRGWVWYSPHDGLGASLELLNPNVMNDTGENWAPSKTTNGTPGGLNSVSTNNIPPLILEVTHFPVIPKSTEQVVISARISDESPSGYSANLFWRVDAASPPAFTSLAMHDDGLNGDAVASDGLWSARIPAQANNSVIEFYVSATDAQGRNRTWPAPAIAAVDLAGPTGQVVNALFQFDNTVYAPTNSQPLYKLIMTESERAELAQIPSQSTLQGPNARMNGTFISIDGGGTEFRYSVAFRNRGHGSRSANPPNYHVDFCSDARWKGVLAMNLNSQNVHIQHLGSVLARKAGVDGATTIAAQVRVNNANLAPSGSPTYGSYAANEEQDSDYASAHFPNDPNGNVYRAVRDQNGNFDYRGEDKNAYKTTYFKESNASVDDWTDMINMLRVMGTGNVTPFTTANVRAVVNVEQWMRHLAVMNLFGNNESGLNTGFNDDYFMYAGVLDPRFQLTYWDLDTILGQGGSLPSNSGLFTATANNGSGVAFDRFMNWPDFQPIYYQALYDILTGPFSQTNFNATVDETIGNYPAASTAPAIKSWMDARRSFVLSQIPAFVVSNAPTATITGTPRSPTPTTSATLTVGGSNVVSYQFSLNGGAFSAETPVATLINVSSLPNGTNKVSVIGKGANGVWQPVGNPTVVQWVVNNTWPAVRINEVLARNVAALNHSNTFPDAIELFNEGGATINLGGLRLSNDKDQPSKFTFAYGTLLGPGSNLVVFANNVDGTPGIHLGFNLDADGDSVRLFAAATNGGAELDSVKFGRQLADLSIARFGNSSEFRLAQPSFGAANVLQPLGDEKNLRINEWLAASASLEDFVELYNQNFLPVALGGLYFTDNLLGDPARNPIEPLTFIGAGEYRAFTANGNGNGGDHLNFSLALEHGEIGLFDRNLAVIDCIVYASQQPDVAQGRCPNGGASWTTLGTPTAGAPNSCPIPPPPPLLSIGGVWSYQPGTNYDAVNWTTNTYDDSTWPTGPALLGRQSFAGGQVLPEPFRTFIETNLTQTNFYFRAHFNVPAGASYISLQLRHIIDDGAVFYLNGVEISGARFNMPAGPINGTVFASSTVSAASYVGPISVPVSMLRTGDNVLAVDVHQSANNSSDVAMGVELQAIEATPALAGVVINEVLANNASIADVDGSKPDWVELYNPSTNAVDLGDMSLTDDTAVSRRWVIPGGTILTAQGFLKIRCNPDLPASATNTGFGFKATGGSAYLFNKLSEGGSLLSSVTYGLQAADFSIGRLPNGGTNWALCTPTFGANNQAATVGDPLLLRINEWMANPASGDEDYFEIYNPNPQPADISKFYLTDNLANRTKQQLPALSFIGIGEDAFQKFVADGNVSSGADHVNFSLAAGGEALGLTSSNNVAIDSISFGPQSAGVSQGRLPDGAATIVNFPATPTPGKPNFLPIANIVVNELLAHTDPPFEDAVEFYNTGATNINIGGWYLSDSQNNLQKYRVPSNTVITAGGYVVFYEYQFNADVGPNAFSFSSAKGDEVYLSQSTNAGTVTGYRAFATFDASENGVSFGRFPTSLGFDFTAMSMHTFGVDFPETTNEFRLGTGQTNAYPKVGPVVINEIMYHPLLTNDLYEFIELRNVLGVPVPLYDTNNPANTWRLRKGVDFNFVTGTTIPANGYLVVVGFDPVADPVSLAAFRAQYGTNITLVGPYSGKLDNNGEELQLQKPDAPQTVPGPDFGLVPYIVADRVVYGDTAPWPTSPDGTGDSLRKLAPTLYGNEALNWQGGAPTPGASNTAGSSNTPPVLVALTNRSVHVTYPVSFTASASDSDLPAQTLTYSLQGTVPSGAAIGSGTGVFNWTPTTNQGPATYPITVRVTDNGAPPLFDEKTFNIAVLNLPKVSSVSFTNNATKLTWVSYPGRRYRVEAATNLVNAVWMQVGSDVIAAGVSTSLTNSVGTNPQKFYRVLSYDN